MKRIFLAMAFSAGAAGAFAAEPQITVTGEAVLVKDAEDFTVRVQIEERNKDREASLAQASVKLEAVKSAITELKGLKEVTFRYADAQTQAIRPLGCYPGGYAQGRTAETCRPIDYQNEVMLLIEGRPAKVAGNAVTLLSDLDVSHAELQGFGLTDRDEAERDARDKALRQAAEQARRLARTAGAKLGPPIQIVYGAEERRRESVPFRASQRRRIPGVADPRAPSAELDLPPTKVVIHERVTVTYELKIK